MRMFFLIIGMACSFVTTACVSQKISQAVDQTPISLTPDQFVGYTLTLDSARRVECYHFGTNGIVLPVFSFTLRRGGIFHRSERAIVNPIYDWKIENGHTLLMTGTPEDEPAYKVQYEFISFTDDLMVTTDGKRFKRTKN